MMPNTAMKTQTYFIVIPKSSPSRPLNPVAATAIAMLCGEMSFPAQAPLVLAAAIHAGSAPIFRATSLCKAPNKTLALVSLPVINVPKETLNNSRY